MNKNITFGADIEIEECKFHHRKNVILLKDVDTQKIHVSDLVSSSQKEL